MVNINLLPAEIKLKIKKAKQSANVFSFCLVVVIVVSVLTMLIGAYRENLLQLQLDTDKKKIETANSDINDFKNLQNEALFLNDRAKIATEIESGRPVWSEILQDLINSVPSNVQFVSLISDIAKSPNFVLQGSTTSEREAIKFKEKLENSAFFKDVAFKSSTASTDAAAAANTLTFTLEFNLEQKAAKVESSNKGTK